MNPKSSASPDPQLEWFKSSYSTDDGPACVEIAPAPATVHIRDSKNPDGPTLQFTPQQWGRFLPFAAEAPSA
ncbi:DUF397 domain-containing protein [Streptomyces sp. TS71-3]|uniref:DUF397 domain-containing protein n=1 Tax=Streptomyces sp. TS71-3 TaxID=2733862 RepID=UPI001B066A56|nr:DUF397 domain-containing protein [Streptomyces sp. TS71-3]GHJ41126.1 hypothetical protein Sm713_67350 [Streptomyces sp. TS71-3]